MARTKTSNTLQSQGLVCRRGQCDQDVHEVFGPWKVPSGAKSQTLPSNGTLSSHAEDEPNKRLRKCLERQRSEPPAGRTQDVVWFVFVTRSSSVLHASPRDGTGEGSRGAWLISEEAEGLTLE